MRNICLVLIGLCLMAAPSYAIHWIENFDGVLENPGGEFQDPNYSGSTTGLDASSRWVMSSTTVVSGTAGELRLIWTDDTTNFCRCTCYATRPTFDESLTGQIGFSIYPTTGTAGVQMAIVPIDSGYERSALRVVASTDIPEGSWTQWEIDLSTEVFVGWITGDSTWNPTTTAALEALFFYPAAIRTDVFYIDSFYNTSMSQVDDWSLY